jgi:hypothetical protein
VHCAFSSFHKTHNLLRFRHTAFRDDTGEGFISCGEGLAELRGAEALGPPLALHVITDKGLYRARGA